MDRRTAYGRRMPTDGRQQTTADDDGRRRMTADEDGRQWTMTEMTAEPNKDDGPIDMPRTPASSEKVAEPRHQEDANMEDTAARWEMGNAPSSSTHPQRMAHASKCHGGHVEDRRASTWIRAQIPGITRGNERLKIKSKITGIITGIIMICMIIRRT